jgi:FkbM family methyltransferase
MLVLTQGRTDWSVILSTSSSFHQISRLLAVGARKLGLHVGADPYSLAYREHLSRVVAKLGIDCVLDVGSYRGDFGSQLRRNGYRGRIVSFEPVMENFQALENRRAGDRDWRAYRMALGAERGHAEIRVFSGTTFHSFLEPNCYGRQRFPGKLNVERLERVMVERLDAVLDDATRSLADPRIFLKIDTQGYDLEVVRGLATRIDEIDALQIEMAVTPIYENMTNSFLDAMEYLQKLGFGLSGVFPVTFDTDGGTSLLEVDCMMCRRHRKVRGERASPAGLRVLQQISTNSPE